LPLLLLLLSNIDPAESPTAVTTDATPTAMPTCVVADALAMAKAVCATIPVVAAAAAAVPVAAAAAVVVVPAATAADDDCDAPIAICCVTTVCVTLLSVMCTSVSVRVRIVCVEGKIQKEKNSVRWTKKSS